MARLFPKILFLLVLGLFGYFALAQDSVGELSSTIENRSQTIEELDAQIAADKKKLQQLEGQKNTLSKTITDLNLSEKTVERSIITTVDTIEKTSEEIEVLGTQVLTLEEQIAETNNYIKATIRELSRSQDKTFWEVFILYNTFSEYLDRIAQFEQTGKVLHQKILDLGQNKNALVEKTEEQQVKKIELIDLTEELKDKKEVIKITKQEKQKVLVKTKNQEQNFQLALAEKLELKRQFEQELLELESKLQIAIDRSKYASRKAGLFSWPTSNFRVTQYFGNTDFARGGAYNGRGHSGVDFGVPIGTPVRAVMDGKVRAAFDTDSVGAKGSDGVYRACVSYGKYVLIEHDNGLSTLVAHNSLIKVKFGQRVKRGDIIAYSGNSGYSTGPHLHFSTYATQGVQVKKLGDVSKTTVYCKDAVIPVISLTAYLDPYDYLPRPEFSLKSVKLGDNNASVRELQMMLKHERLFPIEQAASGQYGATTAAAVLGWQKRYDVEGAVEGKGQKFDAKSIERYKELLE